MNADVGADHALADVRMNERGADASGIGGDGGDDKILQLQLSLSEFGKRATNASLTAARERSDGDHSGVLNGLDDFGEGERGAGGRGFTLENRLNIIGATDVIENENEHAVGREVGGDFFDCADERLGRESAEDGGLQEDGVVVIAVDVEIVADGEIGFGVDVEETLLGVELERRLGVHVDKLEHVLSFGRYESFGG